MEAWMMAVFNISIFENFQNRSLWDWTLQRNSFCTYRGCCVIVLCSCWLATFVAVVQSLSHCPPPCYPHELQHTRLPCPSLCPRVCLDSCPLNWWYAIQPSHPRSTFSSSQHQGLFRGVVSLHHMARVLKLQLQHQSFQWIFIVDFL